jgi:hypothetical protein
MKYIQLSIIGLCVILMANGCSGGKARPGVGFFPKIINATMVNVDNTAGTFTAGDRVAFSVEAQDEDLNMKTLWVTEYSSDDLDTPFVPPYEIALPTQSSQDMTYTDLGQIPLTGPAGTYTMNLQIEDATGNKTDVYTIGFTLK